MSKFWHIAATVGAVALAATVPVLRDTVAHHAGTVGLAGAGWAILGNVLKSPFLQ